MIINDELERMWKEATVIKFEVQTLRDLRSSYVPEGPAQVEFCASRNWVYKRPTIQYMYIKGSPP